MQDAEKLNASIGGSKRVAFIACSYDTSFEPVEKQVIQKVEQLIETFGLDGKVRWSLWVVDDLPDDKAFGRAVRQGFNAVSERIDIRNRLNLLKLKSLRPIAGGLKGRALLDGMVAALENDPDLAALVYINLNLKVGVDFSVRGLMQVLCEGFDAAIGTRYHGDGGVIVGRGLAGNIKSLVYNYLVRKLFPPINSYYDTNAPMKAFNPAAAGLLVRCSETPTVSMDPDWLLLLHLNGYKVSRFPVAWVQRSGSRPPWQMILPCFMDILKIRKRWKRGLMGPQGSHPDK
ncbi:MAG: hypothetical protein GY868_14860 [Deltaproteobacteria bacterium]|nr:hypothetical protein [Deltaproteobacteria bacterium]